MFMVVGEEEGRRRRRRRDVGIFRPFNFFLWTTIAVSCR
jgi:hypothetical protein